MVPFCKLKGLFSLSKLLKPWNKLLHNEEGGSWMLGEEE